MAFQSAPYYWLTCDGPDCGIKSTEDSEFGAWVDAGQAADDATNADWVLTNDGKHYCWKHAPKCPTCECNLSEDGTCEDSDDDEHKE